MKRDRNENATVKRSSKDCCTRYCQLDSDMHARMHAAIQPALFVCMNNNLSSSVVFETPKEKVILKKVLLQKDFQNAKQ